MTIRALIISKWLTVSALYFIGFSLFMPSVLASVLSTLLTVGAFFHPSNKKEIDALKRPVLIIGGNHAN